MPLKLQVEIGLKLWMLFEVDVEKGKFGCELAKLHTTVGALLGASAFLSRSTSANNSS